MTQATPERSSLPFSVPSVREIGVLEQLVIGAQTRSRLTGLSTAHSTRHSSEGSRGHRKGSKRQRSEGLRGALAPRRQAENCRHHEQSVPGSGARLATRKPTTLAIDSAGAHARSIRPPLAAQRRPTDAIPRTEPRGPRAGVACDLRRGDRRDRGHDAVAVPAPRLKCCQASDAEHRERRRHAAHGDRGAEHHLQRRVMRQPQPRPRHQHDGRRQRQRRRRRKVRE